MDGSPGNHEQKWIISPFIAGVLSEEQEGLSWFAFCFCDRKGLFGLHVLITDREKPNQELKPEQR